MFRRGPPSQHQQHQQHAQPSHSHDDFEDELLLNATSHVDRHDVDVDFDSTTTTAGESPRERVKEFVPDESAYGSEQQKNYAEESSAYT